MFRRSPVKLAALVSLAAVVAAVLVSGDSHESRASGYYPGQSGQTAAPDGITVTGIGAQPVQRPRRLGDRAIARAVAAAQAAAFPEALTDARAHAEAIARAAGLRVGAVESVADTGDTYSAGVAGRFGIRRHCGVIARRIFRRDETGRAVVRRTRRRHRCIVPRQSVVTLTVRYERD
jgi:hypothetical protein